MKRLPVRLTQHASDVLEERHISVEWVVRAIEQPVLACQDAEDEQLAHALAPIPERQGRVLRVVYNREASGIRVVTAYFDRSMRGKL